MRTPVKETGRGHAIPRLVYYSHLVLLLTGLCLYKVMYGTSKFNSQAVCCTAQKVAIWAEQIPSELQYIKLC